MNRLRNQPMLVGLPDMRRETHSLRPPIFWNIRCLVAIMGESGDSERNYGLSWFGEKRD